MAKDFSCVGSTECRLGEYISIRTGRLDANAAETDGEYPFFTCAREISRINSWAFDCECVLVAGNCTPHVSYYNGKFNAYQRVYIIESNDPGRLSTKYLYYFFKEYMALAIDKQHGAIEKFFCLSDFTEIKISLPDLPTQLRIAGILGSLDEKIELNRKKIAELEALAKTIYDYWFVQFDFPDKNGKPYYSSGGKMVWNERLKREVPEGWEVGTIHSICDLLVGGTPSKKVSDYWNGSIPFWGPTDCSDSIFQFHTAEQITDSGFAHCSSDMIPENSTVITARGSIGKVAMVGVKMAMNQSCFAFHSNDGEDVFLYYLAKQLVNHLKQTSTGSVFNAFVSSDLKNVILSLGNKSVRHLYSQIADGVFMQIKTLVQQINELINLRDTLLPLLMNGQVVVK